jgi:hypothetical protein
MKLILRLHQLFNKIWLMLPANDDTKPAFVLIN